MYGWTYIVFSNCPLLPATPKGTKLAEAYQSNKTSYLDMEYCPSGPPLPTELEGKAVALISWILIAPLQYVYCPLEMYVCDLGPCLSLLKCHEAAVLKQSIRSKKHNSLLFPSETLKKLLVNFITFF